MVGALKSKKEAEMKTEGIKLVANNKKAYHDYFIEEKYEAGLVLHGTEVKSLRMGKCSIKEAFIRIEKGEVYIYGMHISPYEKGNIFNNLFGICRLSTEIIDFVLDFEININIIVLIIFFCENVSDQIRLSNLACAPNN